jgi:hypothetical protein
VFRSHLAYAVSCPDAGGVAHALLDAVHDDDPTGLLVPVVERNPEPVMPPVGTKFGATEYPPPETWVLPVQAAVADCVLPEPNATEALVVMAGAFCFFFFATAGEATPRASSAVSAAATISPIRLRGSHLSPVDTIAILSAPTALLTTTGGVRVIEIRAVRGVGKIGRVPEVRYRGGTRMTRKRSRLALFGVLMVVLSVTVGLVSGSVADAKKKKKSANVANVSKTVNAQIPDRAPGANGLYGRLDTGLTVGKKFKGKTVGSLELTFQTTGDSANSASDIQIDIIAPNGYRLPGDWWDNSLGGQSIGPLTIGPNSPVRTCNTATPPCNNPFNTLNRPFIGTVGDNVFQWLRGLPMKGNWTIAALDTGVGELSVLNSVALKITAA